MYIKREYTLDYFRKQVFTEEFVIITSNINNSRSQAILKEFPSAKYIDVDYRVEKNDNGILVDSFSINTNYNSILNATKCTSLYQDLRDFVEKLHEERKSIIIDISGMHLRFLGALIATLSEWDWDSIICAYTEIVAYPRLEETQPVGNDCFPNSVGFDLNSSFWGYNEIPNLKTTTSDRSNYVWIVFLGFEGKRAAAVYTEISDDTNTTIPVITVPSVKPGWPNFAFDANQFLFENANLHCVDIRYTDALDPFATFNFLEQIQDEYPNRHLVISPLGTRPVSLGVLLYALKNEESEVYFDTPKESCSKILNSGKIHIYDILSFFNNDSF